MIAEPTGTGGCRMLCRQFSTSSLNALAHCISRSKKRSLTTKHMMLALLPFLTNGDQGQNTRHTVPHRTLPFPCLFPVQRLHLWGRDGDVCCALLVSSPQHKHSRGGRYFNQYTLSYFG